MKYQFIPISNFYWLTNMYCPHQYLSAVTVAYDENVDCDHQMEG